MYTTTTEKVGSGLIQTENTIEKAIFLQLFTTIFQNVGTVRVYITEIMAPFLSVLMDIVGGVAKTNFIDSTDQQLNPPTENHAGM